MVLPWMTMWLVLWGYSRDNTNENEFPSDRYASPYLLPFFKGQRFFVSQGVGGIFSHTDATDYYAYDFMVGCGTPIVACRDGTVSLVIDTNDGNLLSSKSTRNNLVYISHDGEGSTARYLHIQKGSALVKEGCCPGTSDCKKWECRLKHSSSPSFCREQVQKLHVQLDSG
jgi:murein DD-endopeptidase MepM/ murein hydrolase activator NlpD